MHPSIESHQRQHQQTDGFDRLPDSLILLIFNGLSDIKTLIRCRAVSKRFNSLVPQAETLLLKVDCVISAEPDDSFLVNFLRSIVKSFQDLISPKRIPSPTRSQNSPTKILRGFERIRRLDIELPAGDLRLERGAVIKWKAEFGKTLRSCVILGFRAIGDSPESDGGEIDFAGEGGGGGGGGLKVRVVWTISALIAASARHYLLKEVIREHREMERLVLRDREGEGTVVVDKEGLRECREEEGGEGEEGETHVSDGVGWRNNRTTVPAVRMRMRHEPRLELTGGVRMDGATLVVVRPTTPKDVLDTNEMEMDEQRADADLAFGAFGGVFGEAVKALLKSRSYLLEMNSF